MKILLISATLFILMGLATNSLTALSSNPFSTGSLQKEEAEEKSEAGEDKEKKESKEEGEEGEKGEEGEEGEENNRVGPDKAVQEVNANGFRLSPEAMTTVGVKFKPVENKTVTIEHKYLATSRDKGGVYRFRNGFFKFVPVIIRSTTKTEYIVESSELTSGDKIVTEGLGIISITDVFSTDTAEYGE